MLFFKIRVKDCEREEEKKKQKQKQKKIGKQGRMFKWHLLMLRKL
jgi:hypothetical protein